VGAKQSQLEIPGTLTVAEQFRARHGIFDRFVTIRL